MSIPKTMIDDMIKKISSFIGDKKLDFKQKKCIGDIILISMDLVRIAKKIEKDDVDKYNEITEHLRDFGIEKVMELDLTFEFNSKDAPDVYECLAKTMIHKDVLFQVIDLVKGQNTIKTKFLPFGNEIVYGLNQNLQILEDAITTFSNSLEKY